MIAALEGAKGTLRTWQHTDCIVKPVRLQMSGTCNKAQAWSEPQVPGNEALRSQCIQEYSFDTPRDSNLSTFVQSLANSLATITRCKIVCLSIVKDDKQFFYARHGLDAPETPRSVSFCAHAINRPQEPLIVLNALKDDRFAANPLVLGDPNIRFYHGVPLVNMEGAALGALCSIDDKPSQLKPDQEEAFNLMARMCVCQLELVRIFRLARYDDEGNRRKREKTIKHIRTTMGSNIAFLPSTNAILRTHMESSNGIYDEFESLLRDEQGSMMVFFQLGKEQNLELLMFWQLAEVYRAKPCVEFLVGAVDAFLISNSQYEVNLNEKYKRQIIDVYDRLKSLLKQDIQTAAMREEAQALCKPELLDKLQLDMFVLLYKNAYERLRESPAYEEYSNPRVNRSASLLRSIVMLSPWGKRRLSRELTEGAEPLESPASRSSLTSLGSKLSATSSSPSIATAKKKFSFGRERRNTTDAHNLDKSSDSFLERIRRRKSSGSKTSPQAVAIESVDEASPKMSIKKKKEESATLSKEKISACHSPLTSLRFVVANGCNKAANAGSNSPRKYSLSNLGADVGTVVLHNSTDTDSEEAIIISTAEEGLVATVDSITNSMSPRTAVS